MSLWKTPLMFGILAWFALMYGVLVLAGLKDWVDDKWGYTTIKGGAIYFTLLVASAFIPLTIIVYLWETFMV